MIGFLIWLIIVVLCVASFGAGYDRGLAAHNRKMTKNIITYGMAASKVDAHLKGVFAIDPSKFFKRDNDPRRNP